MTWLWVLLGVIAIVVLVSTILFAVGCFHFLVFLAEMRVRRENGDVPSRHEVE